MASGPGLRSPAPDGAAATTEAAGGTPAAAGAWPRGRRAVRVGLPLVAFVALAFAATWPLGAHLATHTADVGVGDPLLFAKMLDRHLHWLRGETALFDLGVLYPHPQVFATTDLSLGVLYVALPLLALTRDLLALVNLGVILSFGLTAHAAYLWVARVTGDRDAAWVGGVATGFTFWRLHQLDHTNVLQTQWVLYLGVALLALRARPTPGRALAALALGALALTASVNLALYTAAFAVALWAWALATQADAPRGRYLAWSAALAVALAALAWPVFRPYLLEARIHDMHRGATDLRAFSGRVEQLGAAPEFSLLHARGAASLGRESLTFPGWIVLALGAVALGFTAARRRATAAAALVGAALLAIGPWQRGAGVAGAGLLMLAVVAGPRDGARARDRATWLLLAVGGLYLLAALGPVVRHGTELIGPGVWAWLRALPGFASVRTPARFYVVTTLALGLIAGLGAAVLLERVGRPRARRALAAALAGAAFIEVLAAPLPLRAVRTLARAPAYVAWLAAQPGRGAVLELPVVQAEERYRMFWSVRHGRPLVDGESGVELPVQQWTQLDLLASPRGASVLQRLGWAGLEYVVVHGELLRPEARGPLEGALRAAGAAPAATPDPGQDVVVWRLPSPGAALPLASGARVVALGAAPAPGGLMVSVELAVRGDAGIFEPGVRALRVEASGPGVVGAAPLYLAPALVAPASVDHHAVLVPLPADAALDGLRLRLVDEDGAELAATTLGGGPEGRCAATWEHAGRVGDAVVGVLRVASTGAPFAWELGGEAAQRGLVPRQLAGSTVLLSLRGAVAPGLAVRWASVGCASEPRSP